MSAKSWLPVVGYEGSYSVSDAGDARSEPRAARHQRGGMRQLRGCELKQNPGQYGYPSVCLSKNGEVVRRQVHHLVLEAFKGPRPTGMEAAHGDGSPANAALSNLRWDTPAGNNADKVKHGTAIRGERHSMAKLTNADVLAIRSDQRTQRVIARDFCINQAHVSLIKSGRAWAHLQPQGHQS